MPPFEDPLSLENTHDLSNDSYSYFCYFFEFLGVSSHLVTVVFFKVFDTLNDGSILILICYIMYILKLKFFNLFLLPKLFKVVTSFYYAVPIIGEDSIFLYFSGVSET